MSELSLLELHLFEGSIKKCNKPIDSKPTEEYPYCTTD